MVQTGMIFLLKFEVLQDSMTRLPEQGDAESQRSYQGQGNG